MRSPKKTTRIALASLLCFSLLAAIGACVTVNVNFPESAVQKATDEYVRELYKARDRKTPAGQPSGSPTSEFHLPVLLAVAYAEEAINMSSPEIKAIQKNQISRLDRISTEKKSGNLGENSEGLLVVKTEKKILQMKLEKLVTEENKDREKLFAEVMKLNPIPESQLRKNFSRSFQDKMSPSGTWVQSADGEWSQKP
jgi:uncharacterized protein YdbL (DUF1318 family)